MTNINESNWDDTLLLAQQQLQGFAQREDFWTVIDNIFGTEYDRSKVEASQQAWQVGDFSLLPKIQVLDSASMAGIEAGFSAQMGLIYVNSDLLANATTDQIAAVLVEEIGHWLDDRINVNDTPGDEGEVFAAVLAGQPVYPSILTEDDSREIYINSQPVKIEASSPTSLIINPIASISENSTALFSGNVSNSSAYDSFKLSVDWGDSSDPDNNGILGQQLVINPNAPRSFSFSHLYRDNNSNNSYQISAQLSQLEHVGQYRVSDGPSWVNNPPVYSAVEASALIFGGIASNYSTSTELNSINHLGWYDGWGEPWKQFPEYYKLDSGVPGYNNPGGGGTAYSAYIQDHIDFTKINYVWRNGSTIQEQVDVQVFNVAPVIGNGTTIGNITELSDSSANENNFDHTASGSLTFTDVGINDSHTVAVTPSEPNYHGTLTASIANSATGDGTGSIDWNFSVVDSDLDFLASGETITQTYALTTRDDDGDTANKSLTVNITGANDAPTVDKEIGNQTTQEDELLNFQVPDDTFKDVDTSDTLTYTAILENGTALPDWLNFNADTRAFSGTPKNDDVGSISLKVTATDSDGAKASNAFNLSVNNTNDEPTVDKEISNQVTQEDSEFNYIIPGGTFNDVDTSDTLTYTATLENGDALPDWLNFNADTRAFSGTPKNDDVGSISLKVTATDSDGAKASNTFALEVTNVNDAPELTNNNRLTLKERTTSTITNSLLNVTDVDNTAADITYKVTDSTDFGALKLNGVALGVNSIFTQAEIDANKLTYTHNPIETASDNFAFTVTDGAGGNIGSTVFNIGVTPVNETLNGTIRNDTIKGLAGNDTINGLAGIDNLNGGSGNDAVTGGSGNDNLVGNTGFDILTGGSGADRFIFNSKNEGRDGIIDFSVVDDTLVVSKAGFGGGLTANAAIAAAQFQVGSVAKDQSDRFIYNKSTGGIFFDTDGIGGTAQIQFAQLSTGLDMTYRDIFVAA